MEVVDAGQPMVGGERMGADSSGAEEQRNALADEEWTTFRARVDREWRARRALSPDDPDLAGPPPPGDSPNEYGLTDFGDRLLSGPAAELFGSSPGSGFEAFGSAPQSSPGPE